MTTPKKKIPSRLKNFTTDLTEAQIFDLIRKSLAEHRAKRISFDYDDNGLACALSFQLQIHHQVFTFRLPARLDNVKRLVEEAYQTTGLSLRGKSLDDQAYRTAWANIKDWVIAQMALVDAEMVKVEEIFLPYLLTDDDRTFFEEFEQHRQLPAPRITEVK